MPIVTIQVTKEGSGPGRDSVTEQEKAALIAGVSELLLDVLNKPLESTFCRHRRGRAGELGVGRIAGSRVPPTAYCGRRLGRYQKGRPSKGRPFFVRASHRRPRQAWNRPVSQP